MITILSRKQDSLGASDISRVNKEIIEYCGLSTDDKPTGLIVTGSTFLEIDTGDLYIYNEEGGEWSQFLNIKGEGGGGGGSTEPETITVTVTDNRGYNIHSIPDSSAYVNYVLYDASAKVLVPELENSPLGGTIPELESAVAGSVVFIWCDGGIAAFIENFSVSITSGDAEILSIDPEEYKACIKLGTSDAAISITGEVGA